MHKLPTMQIILSFLEPAEKEHRVLYRMEGDGRWWMCYQKGEVEHPNENFIWETLDGQVYPSTIKSHNNSVVVWIEMAAIGSPIYMLSHQGVALPVKIRRCGPVRVDVALEEVCCWGELWGFKKTYSKPRVSLFLLPADLNIKLSATSPTTVSACVPPHFPPWWEQAKPLKVLASSN